MLDLLKTTLGRLRVIAFTEGMSYLILLFVAMPLKYIWGQPAAVKNFGTVHGLLFVLYIIYVLLCKIEYRWTLKKALVLFGISIIPFGNFYADKHYLRAL
jgi:integral membrane protein